MIHEFKKPIPVVVNENGEERDGYVIYVESGGMFENDCWTICLCESGVVRHYATNQIKIYFNQTYGIKKQ